MLGITVSKEDFSETQVFHKSGTARVQRVNSDKLSLYRIAGIGTERPNMGVYLEPHDQATMSTDNYSKNGAFTCTVTVHI